MSNKQIEKTNMGQLLFYLLCHAISAFPSEINELGLYTEAYKVQNCPQSLPFITGIIVSVIHNTLSPKNKGAIKIFAKRKRLLHKSEDSGNKRGRAWPTFHLWNWHSFEVLFGVHKEGLWNLRNPKNPIDYNKKNIQQFHCKSKCLPLC